MQDTIEVKVIQQKNIPVPLELKDETIHVSFLGVRKSGLRKWAELAVFYKPTNIEEKLP